MSRASTDGDAAYNTQLSQARAQAVLTHLERKFPQDEDLKKVGLLVARRRVRAARPRVLRLEPLARRRRVHAAGHQPLRVRRLDRLRDLRDPPCAASWLPSHAPSLPRASSPPATERAEGPAPSRFASVKKEASGKRNLLLREAVAGRGGGRAQVHADSRAAASRRAGGRGRHGRVRGSG